MTIIDMERLCTKCGAAPRLTHSPWCRDCKNAQGRDLYRRDRDRIRSQQRAYQLAHRDELIAASRRYRVANAERLRQKRRDDYARDPAGQRAKAEAWKQANPERHRFIQRRSHLKLRYGLTPEQYDALLIAQDHRCALCRKASPRRLHVDHDHGCCAGLNSCGACVRGLLCFTCNRLLGWFEANDRSIVDYLAGRSQTA
jgi:hypothetical protein